MADFDVTKLITPADVATAVTAGVVAYVMNRHQADDQQQGQSQAQPEAQPQQPIPSNPFYDEVPDVPNLTPQEARAFDHCQFIYGNEGWNNCSIGNDLAFPSKWDVERWANRIGCEPEKLQALIDKGASDKMLGKLYCLGEVGNYSTVGFQATNTNNMEFILDSQGDTKAICAMFKTLLDGGDADSAAVAFLNNLHKASAGSLHSKAVAGALAKLGG